MKGYPLIIAALVATREEPQTIRQLAARLDILYIPAMYLVRELKASGLIHEVGTAPPNPRGGYGGALYGLKGGEAVVMGRGFTRAFLRLWNALQQPVSADEAAEECQRTPNYVRKKIMEMHKAKLVYRAGWIRGAKAEPTCLFAIGSKRDIPRPKPLSEQEYNRRANAKRGINRLLARDPWDMMKQQLRMAA